jgi:hypothetical protein
MKKLFILLFALCSLLHAQGQTQTGYLITLTRTQTAVFRTQNKAEADSIVSRFLAAPVDIEKLMNGTNYFDFKNGVKYLYCEKKEVVKSRSGKLIYKRIKKKRK